MEREKRRIILVKKYRITGSSNDDSAWCIRSLQLLRRMIKSTSSALAVSSYSFTEIESSTKYATAK